MAHSKQRNGGQRHASIRKSANQTRRFQEDTARAAALGITILTLRIKENREFIALHEAWKRKPPPLREDDSRFGMNFYGRHRY